jgi:hypothetical protein
MGYATASQLESLIDGLRCVILEPLPSVPLRVDRRAIARIVDNIVQNALCHATGAGELRFSGPC